MSPTLPYSFDNSSPGRSIVRGMLSLLFFVIAPGIVYSLLVSHDRAAVAALTLIGMTVVYFGRRIVPAMPTDSGTITDGEVTVRPMRVWGIRLASPEGVFPLNQFACIRIEEAPATMATSGKSYERVWLAGRLGTPDVLIARTDRDAGVTLGRDLATLLGLPVEEQAVPY